VHTLDITASRSLRLVRADLADLRVDMARYDEPNYPRTQEIGAATAFLGYHGLIVPSARWSRDNVVLFADNMISEGDLRVIETEQIEWQAWARSAGKLTDD
jgi:hypothetical protein